MKITDLFLILFATIAAFNLGTGCLLTIDRILKTFGSKSHIWMWVYIIATSLGVVALKFLLERS